MALRAAWHVKGGAGPRKTREMAPNNPNNVEALAHSAFRKWLMKFQALVEFGRRPVEKLFLLGEQTASWQYARSNVSPVSASFWMLGVLMNPTS